MPLPGRTPKRFVERRIAKKMVPLVGFELTTYRLQGGCSTPELKRHMLWF